MSPPQPSGRLLDPQCGAIVRPLHPFLAAFLLLLSSALIEAGPQRLWKYTDGRKFTGEYLWSSTHTLYLKDRNGKEIEVQLGALSNADLEFVRELNSKFSTKGIIYHTPLTWEEFRSKKLTASQALERGYFPIDSLPASEGSLRIEFRRFGPAPKVSANQKVVLRMTTAQHGGSQSTIRVVYGGKVIGAVSGAPAHGDFDIPLPATVLQGSEKIVLDLKGGSDTVLIRTGKSGAGPRLLIIESEQNPE